MPLSRQSRVLTLPGDTPILTAAKAQIRNEFSQNSNLSDTQSVQEAVQKAEDVARILRENIVQGKKQDGVENTYGTRAQPTWPCRLQTTPSCTFAAANDTLTELRIHEHTERGDNESIKNAGNGSTKAGGGCCQG